MRKILSVLFIIVLICGIFSGCSNDNSNPSENISQSITENTNNGNADDNQNATSDNSFPNEIEKEDDNTKCQNCLKDTKIELLSISSGISFSDMFTDGFYPNDYDNKTSMITLGITFNNKEAYNNFYSIEFFGETATNPKDPSDNAFQTLKETYTTDDKLYSICIYTVQGTVDPSKVQMLVMTDNKEIYENRTFENNGKQVGFDNAIEKFSQGDDAMNLPSSVLKLKDRHYKVVHFGRTDLDCIDLEVNQNKHGYDLIAEYRIGLLPIEKSYKRTLKTEDVKIIGDTDANIKYTVEVKSENIFGGSENIHTSIYVTATKHVASVPLKNDGYIDYDACKPLLNEVDETLHDISIEITNNDGVITIPITKR